MQNPSPAPPRSGEGSYCGMFNFSPPALLGKGAGGLGRMRNLRK